MVSNVVHAMMVVFSAMLPLMSSGCGLAMVHGPPSPEERESEFTCTTSNLGPGLDVLAGVAGLGLVGIAATNQDFDDYFYYVSDEFSVIGVTAAVLFTVSAVVGFHKTRACREAGAAPGNVDRVNDAGTDESR